MVPTRLKVALAIALAAALAGVGYALTQHVEATRLARDLQQAQQQHQEALQQAGAAQAAQDRAAALQTQVDALEAQRIAQDRRVGELEAALAAHPVPPHPGPAPSDRGELVAGLERLGVHPRWTVDTLAFPGQEGGTLWTWGQEAQRVPALEGRLAAEDALTQGLRTSLDTTRQELGVAKQQGEAQGQAAAHYQAAFTDEQRARASAEAAAARAEHLRQLASLPWAVGVSYAPPHGDWGVWATRDWTFFRVGAEVSQVHAPATAGGGVTVDTRLLFGVRLH